jgi:methyl-accepting chemotaxis protein
MVNATTSDAVSSKKSLHFEIMDSVSKVILVAMAVFLVLDVTYYTQTKASNAVYFSFLGIGVACFVGSWINFLVNRHKTSAHLIVALCFLNHGQAVPFLLGGFDATSIDPYLGSAIVFGLVCFYGNRTFVIVLAVAGVSVFMIMSQAWPNFYRFGNPLERALWTALSFSVGLFFLALMAGVFRKVINQAEQARTAAEESRVKERESELARASVEERLTRQRADELASLARRFETEVLNLVTGVATRAECLNSITHDLTEATRRTEDDSSKASLVSAEALSQAQQIAAGTDELAAATREIAHQIQFTEQNATEAVDAAMGAQTVLAALTSATEKIGEVVNLISSIASQTNLLALNATIEAARAGDAGRGFAIVASEVKALANQTSKATGDIDAQVQSIRSVAREAVEAMQNVSATIKKVNSASMSIASAVGQQQAVTGNIAAGIAKTADNSRDLSNIVSSLKEVAVHAGASSSRLSTEVTETASAMETLKTSVTQFVGTIRAA